MRDFNYSTIRDQKWDSEILGLVAAIYREAGKQEFYLKQRPEINADSVGVIGHSEGAFVAFSMAARKEVPFIITLAGGGVSGSELLLMQRLPC